MWDHLHVSEIDLLAGPARQVQGMYSASGDPEIFLSSTRLLQFFLLLQFKHPGPCLKQSKIFLLRQVGKGTPSSR